jgi:protein-S-isoprenylcysteine O-methyltransferase Ste14
MLQAESSDPRVAVFPPVLPISGFALGLLLEQLAPARTLVSAAVLGHMRSVGIVLLVIGACGFASMVITMKRARTPIHTSKRPTTLVESGPFRITRNPMYLFGSVAYTGIALSLQLVWPLVFVPAVQIATHYLVVLREEQILARRFGDAYARYCARVRRWL